MEEDKENSYLTCPIARQCYSNYLSSDLYCIALETNDPNDWSKVPMLATLVTCVNMDCLMRKDYKRAMENIKEQMKN